MTFLSSMAVFNQRDAVLHKKGSILVTYTTIKQCAIQPWRTLKHVENLMNDSIHRREKLSDDTAKLKGTQENNNNIHNIQNLFKEENKTMLIDDVVKLTSKDFIGLHPHCKTSPKECKFYRAVGS